MDPSAAPYPPPPVYGCYRHPDRGTRIGCQRCGRPICPECMRPAAVGFQCPECVAAGQAQVQPQLARAQRAGALRTLGAAPVTITLIGTNVLVWAAIMLTGGNRSRLVDWLALQATASCGIGDSTYVDVTAAACAAEGGTFFPGVVEGGWWQMLTSAFTHVQPMHIGFNMLALWFLGPQLERFFGLGRYLALYLLSALAGSVAVLWLSEPSTLTVGASGAVFGLMGALLIVAWRRGGDVQNILMWLGINVVFTFAGGPGISWQGHLGGLVGGAVLALVMLGEGGRPTRRSWLLVGAVGVALVLLAAARVVTSA